jgi:hypothetical protein
MVVSRAGPYVSLCKKLECLHQKVLCPQAKRLTNTLAYCVRLWIIVVVRFRVDALRCGIIKVRKSCPALDTPTIFQSIFQLLLPFNKPGMTWRWLHAILSTIIFSNVILSTVILCTEILSNVISSTVILSNHIMSFDILSNVYYIYCHFVYFHFI